MNIKRIYMAIMASMLAVAAINAKEIKEVRYTTEPPMHCESCEIKIKNALKFEKGVKDITTDIPNQCVTVKYDADKGSEEAFVKALGKVGYEVRPFGACQGEEQSCDKATPCAAKSGEGAKSCCKQQSADQNAGCTKNESGCQKSK